MSLLHHTLNRFLAQQEMIEVYRERLVPDALVGRVLGVSPTLMYLEAFDTPGDYDGVVAIRPNDITRIRAGDRQLKVESRLAGKRMAFEATRVTLLEPSTAITILAQRFRLVTVRTEQLKEDLWFSGEPIELDDDHVLFRQWGTPRTLEKYELVLKLDEITRVDADTKYLRMLVRAYELASGERSDDATHN